MYAAVAALRLALTGQPPVVTLIAMSVVGAVVYVAAIALLSRRHLVSISGFARTLLGRGAPKAA
jgi:hypothetical protein